MVQASADSTTQQEGNGVPQATGVRPELPDAFAQEAGAQFGQFQQQTTDPRQLSLQWGTRAKPSHPQGGLTIDDLNIGIYAHIPDHVEARNRIPRGAIPLRGVTDIGGYSVCDAHRLWSDHAGELYEEAIQRRWTTATDLPWETGHDLPEDVELAVCQVATELATHAQVEMETISRWFRELNPTYHEVKLHLSCNVFEAARLFDGYRKRAMLNGGGMMLESPGWVNRIILECISGWTETSVLLFILRGSFTQTILRYLSVHGPSELDRELALRCLADKTRHIQYGMDHLRFSFSKVPERARAYSVGLAAAEAQVARDERDHVLWEALAIIFGGGVRRIDEGMEIVARLRRDWVNAYVERLEWAGVPRRQGLISPLKRWIEEPEAVEAAG
jgi:hypothetical protein